MFLYIYAVVFEVRQCLLVDVHVSLFKTESNDYILLFFIETTVFIHK